jgi:hypothetical protein
MASSMDGQQEHSNLIKKEETEEPEQEASTSSDSNSIPFAVNRSEIAQDRALLDDELAQLGEHVAVYAQETLEHGFLSQVDRALERQKDSRPDAPSKFAHIVTAKTDDRVRFGDLTPFELSASNQKSPDEYGEVAEPKLKAEAEDVGDNASEKSCASGSEYAPSEASLSDSEPDVEVDAAEERE